MSTTDTTSADYKNLIDLLAVFSEAKQRLAALELDAQSEFTGIIDEARKPYTDAQIAVTQSEAAIVAIAEAHPEWFAARRSLKTPYGTVSVRKTTKLAIPNEEATILLIKQRFDGEKAADFVRSAEALDLEALEKLDDRELKALRIKRVTDDSISLREAKIDLGKAVKATESEEVAS